MNSTPNFNGSDLTQGAWLTTIADETILLRHALGEPMLLVGRGDEVFVIDAICTNYGALL